MRSLFLMEYHQNGLGFWLKEEIIPIFPLFYFLFLNKTVACIFECFILLALCCALLLIV